jgi:hypothetical protein
MVLPLDHRVQRDSGANTGEGHDNLQDAAEDNWIVRAGPCYEIQIVGVSVKSEGWDRDKGNQIENTCRERVFPVVIHLFLHLVFLLTLEYFESIIMSSSTRLHILYPIVDIYGYYFLRI